MGLTRRKFLLAMGLTGRQALSGDVLCKAKAPFIGGQYAQAENACPFRLSVINDEISQDFENVCRIVARDFGLRWIELRSIWNKNVTELNAKEIEDARKILEKYNLQVTDIASPLFKTDWPGAPRSPQSQTRDQFHANFDAGEQDKLLERGSDALGPDRMEALQLRWIWHRLAHRLRRSRPVL